MPTAAAHSAAQRMPATTPEVETILTSFDTNYAWNYGSVKEGLRELYEKAKREQWNGTTQLAWDTPVDPESEIVPQSYNPLEDYGPYKKLDTKGVKHFRHAMIAWQLSQFMHGEQGALIVASQLIGAVPWMDAKYYAATQTMDEARHVEVFSRYLREKLEWEWPINANLRKLLDLIICDQRWDFKYLGMQILVEGLAMAAFGNLYQLAAEPLVKDLVHYVMRDESRHVAFGVISLKDYYLDMPEPERRDPRGLRHRSLRTDARPPACRRGLPVHGVQRGGSAAHRARVAGDEDVPAGAVRAGRPQHQTPRLAHAAGACGLRAPRDPPVRGLRPGSPGPGDRVGVTGPHPQPLSHRRERGPDEWRRDGDPSPRVALPLDPRRRRGGRGVRPRQPTHRSSAVGAARR